tara:strand:+ start:1021 stop:1383 length:363 start_codon:yes stop_codon:yes gene_type:complete
MKRLVLAVILLLNISPALGEPAKLGTGRIYDGNVLHKFCQDNKGSLKLACTGYVIGVIDTTKAMFTVMKQNNNYFCLPSNANIEQAIDVVKKWLIENPSARHEPATSNVWEALAKAWPCK